MIKQISDGLMSYLPQKTIKKVVRFLKKAVKAKEKVEKQIHKPSQPSQPGKSLGSRKSQSKIPDYYANNLTSSPEAVPSMRVDFPKSTKIPDLSKQSPQVPESNQKLKLGKSRGNPQLQDTRSSPPPYSPERNSEIELDNRQASQLPIVKEKRFAPPQPMKNGEAKGFLRRKIPPPVPQGYPPILEKIEGLRERLKAEIIASNSLVETTSPSEKSTNQYKKEYEQLIEAWKSTEIQGSNKDAIIYEIQESAEAVANKCYEEECYQQPKKQLAELLSTPFPSGDGTGHLSDNSGKDDKVSLPAGLSNAVRSYLKRTNKLPHELQNALKQQRGKIAAKADSLNEIEQEIIKFQEEFTTLAWQIKPLTLGELQELQPEIPGNQSELKGIDPKVYELLSKPLINTNEMGEDEVISEKACNEIQTGLVDELARQMNLKVSRDESSLENINIKDRSMNVNDEFNIHMSQAWLNAKNFLDANEVFESKDTNDTEKIRCEFLTKILLESEKLAGNKLENLMERVKEQLSLLGTPVQLGAELDNNIGDFLRQNANNVDLNVLVEELIETLANDLGESLAKGESQAKIKQAALSKLNNEDMKTYITDSIRIAWKMKIQRPPMSFDASNVGKRWGELQQGQFELAWGSEPNSSEATIAYYKVPAMLHGDKQIGKPSVIVK